MTSFPGSHDAGFLNNRTQTVSIWGEISLPTEVLMRVPKGLVLGSRLFILYVNELPDWVQGSTELFADDSKAYYKASRKDVLQKDLETFFINGLAIGY